MTVATLKSLKAFMRQYGDGIKQDYLKLTPATLAVLWTDLLMVRDQRLASVHANPQAVLWDVDTAFANMEVEVRLTHISSIILLKATQ